MHAPTGWAAPTAECLVWGITGGEISKYLGNGAKLDALPESKAREEEQRVFGGLLQRNGPEKPATSAGAAHLMDRTRASSARAIDARGPDKMPSCGALSGIYPPGQEPHLQLQPDSDVGDRELLEWPKLCSLPVWLARIPRSAFPHGFPYRTTKFLGHSMFTTPRHAEAGIEASAITTGSGGAKV